MKRAAIEAVGSAQDISVGVLRNSSVQGEIKINNYDRRQRKDWQRTFLKLLRVFGGQISLRKSERKGSAVRMEKLHTPRI